MVKLNTFWPACASLANLASKTTFPEIKSDHLPQVVA